MPEQLSTTLVLHGGRCCAAWLAVISCVLCPNFALSAETGERLNAPELVRPNFRAPAADGVFQLPPVAAPDTLPDTVFDGGATVTLRRIRFQGNTVIASGELEAVVSTYLGRPVNAADLESLRKQLTQHYIDRGYVNSGALYATDAIRDETLTIDIVEGRLSAIRTKGMERLNESYLVDRLNGDGKAPFNVEALRERFVLLLDDPLFTRLNARLTPGAKPGEAILDVDAVRARPYQLTAFVNNYRPPSIGSYARGVSGWVRNLTGNGDLLDASLQTATHGSESPRVSLGWHMPITHRGTELQVQLEHGRSSVVEEPLRVLDIHSVLESKEIGIRQIVLENLKYKFALGLSWVQRQNSTTLLGQPFSFTPGEPNGVTKVSAWRFWQEGTYRSDSQVLALRSTFASSRNNLQTITGLPALAAAPPRQQYLFWIGQGQYARQVLDNGAQFIVRSNAQIANQTLVGLDRISIGGVNTVRGYRENQLVRDKGFVASLEFDYPLKAPADSTGFSMSVVPFYDFGQGKNVGEPADTISSLGLATRVRWKGASMDLAVAKRVVHPVFGAAVRGTLQDLGIHLQFSYGFF